MQQHESFHNLLLKALPRLRAHAHAMTRNPALAEDLVQDTVANALAARDSFAAGTNFRVWIHRVLYNRFISDTRKRCVAEDLDHLPEALLGAGSAQEDRFILAELRDAIGRLPPEQRAALLMVAFERMSYDEVADATGCAVGTARSRAFCARHQLQALLLGKVAESDCELWPCIVPSPGRTGAASTSVTDQQCRRT